MVCVTIYLAGPMTGHQDYNVAAFKATAEALRAQGHTVINPHELNAQNPGESWEFYVRHGLREMLVCDEVVLLPGWQLSKGARLEVEIAVQVGIPCREWWIG